MQSVAFVAPLLPGKTEIDRAARQSCANGERTAAHRASRERRGITREAVWIQSTRGGDVAIVHLEADDLQAALAGLSTSPDPFDNWFREHTSGEQRMADWTSSSGGTTSTDLTAPTKGSRPALASLGCRRRECHPCPGGSQLGREHAMAAIETERHGPSGCTHEYLLGQRCRRRS